MWVCHGCLCSVCVCGELVQCVQSVNMYTHLCICRYLLCVWTVRVWREAVSGVVTDCCLSIMEYLILWEFILYQAPSGQYAHLGLTKVYKVGTNVAPIFQVKGLRQTGGIQRKRTSCTKVSQCWAFYTKLCEWKFSQRERRQHHLSQEFVSICPLHAPASYACIYQFIYSCIFIYSVSNMNSVSLACLTSWP